MKEHMEEQNIDVEKFAHQILESEYLVDYWYDAIYLLAALKYIEDPLSLAKEIINQSKRTIQINNYKYQIFLNGCIVILAEMLGPKAVDNPELVSTIVGYADSIFENKRVIDPEYWIQLNHLDNLAAKPKDQLTLQQKNLLGHTRERSRLLSQLASRIYYLTNSVKYFNLMKEYLNSSDENVRFHANFLMSDNFKKEWEFGRLDLFAFESRKIEMSDEEKE